MQKKTCHNRKIEEPAIPIFPIKVVEQVLQITSQLVKPTRIPLKYPCIIYSSSKHCAFDCRKKTKVQNMF